MELSIGRCHCSGDVQVKNGHFVCLECSDEVEPYCAACGSENGLARRKFPKFCGECREPFKARSARIMCSHCREVLQSNGNIYCKCGGAQNEVQPMDVVNSGQVFVTEEVALLNGTSRSPVREDTRNNVNGFIGQNRSSLTHKVTGVGDPSFIEHLTSLLQAAQPISDYRGAFPNSTSTGQRFDAPGSNAMSQGNSAGQTIGGVPSAASFAASGNSVFRSYFSFEDRPSSSSTGQVCGATGGYFTEKPWPHVSSPGNAPGRSAVERQCSLASAASRNSEPSLLLHWAMSVPVTLDQAERLISAASTFNSPQRTGSCSASHFAVSSTDVSHSAADNRSLSCILGTALHAHVDENAGASKDGAASEMPRENPSTTSEYQSPCREHVTTDNKMEEVGGQLKKLQQQLPLEHRTIYQYMRQLTTHNKMEEFYVQQKKLQQQVQLECRTIYQYMRQRTVLPLHVASNAGAGVRTLNDRKPSEQHQNNPSITREDQERCLKPGTAMNMGCREPENHPANSAVPAEYQRPYRENGAAVSSSEEGKTEAPQEECSMNLVAEAHKGEYGVRLLANDGGSTRASMKASYDRTPEKPQTDSSISPECPTPNREYADSMVSSDGKPNVLNELYPCNQAEGCSTEQGVPSEIISSIEHGSHPDEVSSDWRHGKLGELECHVNDQVTIDGSSVAHVAPSRTMTSVGRRSWSAMISGALCDGQPVENNSSHAEPSTNGPSTGQPVSVKDSLPSFERQLLEASGYLFIIEENEPRSIQPMSVDDSSSLEMRPRCN